MALPANIDSVSEHASVCVHVCLSTSLHAPLLKVLTLTPPMHDSFVLTQTLGKAFLTAVAVSLRTAD
jgi:hypothetical protein